MCILTIDVNITSIIIFYIYMIMGGYDVDGSNDDDGNGHHDKDDDGVDDLGYVCRSDFHIDEMSENMIPLTLCNRL